ncbi:MAG: site-specific integrase [Lachnospiraceae bacterium]|nr:site-specific integrase [Lachnospiraceae bacterium]
MLSKLHLLPKHLWCLGLRISEVCTLKGNAYSMEGRDAWIQVYQIKMKNYKRIPIAEGLYRIMQVCIKRHGIGPDDYLFTNRDGGE